MKKIKDIFYKTVPYVFLVTLSLPIILGVVWIFISAFSTTTHGLMPVNTDGLFVGFTLSNWSFLYNRDLWRITGNTLILAFGLTIGVIIISIMAGYALSRIKFYGRKAFLSLTLVLNAFPSITLIIAIYFILKFISRIPIIGDGLPIIGGFGFNTIGGVILARLALQLPLGIWLIKGAFDRIPDAMEDEAFLCGCTTFQTWWKIMVPQIMESITALSILSFIQGWGAFILPYSYIANVDNSTIGVYLNGLVGQTSNSVYGTVAAVGLFQFIPALLFCIYAQKYLFRIYIGSVKVE